MNRGRARLSWALALAWVTGACGFDEALGLPGPSDEGTTDSSTGPGAADFGTGNTFLPDTEGVDVQTGTADDSGGGQSAAQIYATARCSALLGAAVVPVPDHAVRRPDRVRELDGQPVRRRAGPLRRSDDRLRLLGHHRRVLRSQCL